MRVVSFSFVQDNLPSDHRCYVIDCRGLRNPYSIPKLRSLDGRELEVQDYVFRDRRADELLQEARAWALEGRSIAFGCHGGKHRSVAMAERLCRDLAAVGVCVTPEHRCL